LKIESLDDKKKLLFITSKTIEKKEKELS
jgi:hypothetical protein